MVFITRRERFSAAHRLFRPDWTDEKNEEVFGQCSNPNWHGHNYELFVTIKGEINPETGYIVDLKDLSTVIKEKVIRELDHKNINLDCSFMIGKISSTEILTIEIWKQLEGEIEKMGAQLHCVKVNETENNFFEYFG